MIAQPRAAPAALAAISAIAQQLAETALCHSHDDLQQ
jgi:hypothetical protein